MDSDVIIRRMEPADSAALVALDEQTPDTGLLGFYTEYHHDYVAVQQALRPNFVGVVAERPGQSGLVGSGMMTIGVCRVEGEERPYAYLNGLGVHPDYRRRGIASALALKRVELALERIGAEGVILAGIQGGNEGSLRAAMKWATQRIDGRTAIILGTMRRTPPKSVDGLTVRAAEPGDLEEIAAAQNAFYHEANLYPPKSAPDLSAWLAARPFGHAINGYYVVQNRQGSLIAGMGVTREGCLTTSHVVRMPWFMRLANLVIGMFPRDGVGKRLNGHWFWYAARQERAGGYLWEQVRWLERSRATVAMMFYDAQGPVSRAVKPPRFGPPTGGHVVVNSPVPLTADRFIYFNNMLA